MNKHFFPKSCSRNIHLVIPHESFLQSKLDLAIFYYRSTSDVKCDNKQAGNLLFSKQAKQQISCQFEVKIIVIVLQLYQLLSVFMSPKM